MSLLDRVNKVTGFQPSNNSSYSPNASSGSSLLQRVQLSRGEIQPTTIKDSGFPTIAQLPKPDNQNIFQKIAGFIPQTIQDIGNIIKDPFNNAAKPQNIIKDLMNTPLEAYHNIEKNVGTFKADLQNPNVSTSQTVGDYFKTLAAQGNFVISPVSAIFKAAEEVPAAGTLAKIFTTPFTAIGEATPQATNKLIDSIPNNILSQRAKDNLKPGVGEIVSLAAQLVAGHAMEAGGAKVSEKPFTIAKEKVAQLVDRFGHEDARTIQKQAITLAKEKVAQNESQATIPSAAIDSFQGNIAEYKRFGGFTEGSHTPDASLRDIHSAIDTPEIVQHTQTQVENAITTGEMQKNPDGTITLFRGGEPSPKNNLVSYSYKKDVAQGFVDEALRQGKTIPLTEVKVKPEDIKAFIGKAEAEVLLKKDAKVVPANEERAAAYNPTNKEQGEKKSLPAPAAQKQLSAPKENYISGAGFEMTEKANPKKTEMMNAINTYRARVDSFNKNPTPERLARVNIARQSMKRLEQKGLVKETEKQVIKTKVETSQEPKKVVAEASQKSPIASPEAQGGAPKTEPTEIAVPRDQLPVGQGKEKVSRLEERIAEALGKVTDEMKEKLGLTTFNEMNKKDQIAQAAEYVAKNPDEALAVLRGEKQAPKGLLRNSIFVSLQNAAKDDFGLARKLTTLASTRAGQEISILTEVDPNSPVKIATDIYKFKEEQFIKRHAGKSVNAVTKDLAKRIKVKPPQLNDWKALIDQISC